MQVFNLNDVIATNWQRWQEFLRVPSMSLGIYRLKAGAADEQKPHGEDEVYVVISGRASIRTGGQVQAVTPGSLVFIEKSAEHRFVDISEDLTLLVVFAPPEGSCQK